MKRWKWNERDLKSDIRIDEEAEQKRGSSEMKTWSQEDDDINFVAIDEENLQKKNKTKQQIDKTFNDNLNSIKTPPSLNLQKKQRRRTLDNSFLSNKQNRIPKKSDQKKNHKGTKSSFTSDQKKIKGMGSRISSGKLSQAKANKEEDCEVVVEPVTQSSFYRESAGYGRKEKRDTLTSLGHAANRRIAQCISSPGGISSIGGHQAQATCPQQQENFSEMYNRVTATNPPLREKGLEKPHVNKTYGKVSIPPKESMLKIFAQEDSLHNQGPSKKRRKSFQPKKITPGLSIVSRPSAACAHDNLGKSNGSHEFRFPSGAQKTSKQPKAAPRLGRKRQREDRSRREKNKPVTIIGIDEESNPPPIINSFGDSSPTGKDEPRIEMSPKAFDFIDDSSDGEIFDKPKNSKTSKQENSIVVEIDDSSEEEEESFITEIASPEGNLNLEQKFGNFDFVVCPKVQFGTVIFKENSKLKANIHKRGLDLEIPSRKGMEEISFDLKSLKSYRMCLDSKPVLIVLEPQNQCFCPSDIASKDKGKITEVVLFIQDRQAYLEHIHETVMLWIHADCKIIQLTEQEDVNKYLSASSQKTIRTRRGRKNVDENLLFVYPIGCDSRHGISITNQDLERTMDGEFLNDSLIDFYLKHLQDESNEELKKNCHFFSSHFYTKLSSSLGSRSTKAEFEEAHASVKRWTRNVDLFSKRLIFVPVNAYTHWSLTVICNPGEVNKDEFQKDDSIPCIIFMDSMNLHMCSRISENLRRYLEQEWKVQTGTEIEITKENFPLIQPKVPQQSNSSDCGLFVLEYAERIFKNKRFYSITEEDRSTKLKALFPKNLFTSCDIEEKRANLRRLILNLQGQVSEQYTDGKESEQQSNVSWI